MWNVENSAQIIYFEFEPKTEILYFYTKNILYLFTVLALFLICKCRFFQYISRCRAKAEVPSYTLKTAVRC